MNRKRRRGFAAAWTSGWLALSAASAPHASEPPALPPSEPVQAAELVQRGHAASEAGREAEAREQFQRLAAEYPLMSDYAALWLAESLIRQDQHSAAAEVLAGAQREHPQSRLGFDFKAREGGAKAALGDEAGARAAWRAAAASLPRRARGRAPLWLEVADSFAREGQRDSARKAYLDIWSIYPLEPESQRAQQWLDADRAAGGPDFSVPTRHQRANSLYRLGADDKALKAYEEVLEANPPETAVRQIQRAQAELLFRQRRYPEAAEAFGALPQRASVPVWKGRSIARAGRVPEAIDELVAFGRRKPARKSVHNARYIAALLMIDEDREPEARKLFEQVAANSGARRLKRGALWQLAWADYRAGRYRDAIEGFDKEIASHRFALDGLRPRYWKARALQRLEDPSAMAKFEAIAVRFPLSYYGWQSAQRLAEAGHPLVRAAPRTSPPGAQNLGYEDLERVRILIESGLTGEAEKELEAVSRRAAGAQDRLQVAQLFRILGNYHRAQGQSMRIGRAELARGPERHREAFWWHAWPRAFTSHVRAAAAEQGGKVDPALVLAVIREESGYRPAVVSAVGARGLMQLMEPTAREMAERRGRADFGADELFDSGTNIRLGTEYLAELGETFPESRAATIASYNAGPHVVVKWPGREELDEDEWIETIPYDQTQKYVKRVLRSQHAYDSLYDND